MSRVRQTRFNFAQEYSKTNLSDIPQRQYFSASVSTLKHCLMLSGVVDTPASLYSQIIQRLDPIEPIFGKPLFHSSCLERESENRGRTASFWKHLCMRSNQAQRTRKRRRNGSLCFRERKGGFLGFLKNDADGG